MFFADLYDARSSEAEARKKESIRTDTGPNSWTVHRPARELREEAGHYALSAIESFFSWTEHVFILIAILRGAYTTGEAVRDLARADWKTKFKAALDINVPADKAYFDKLLEVRRQVRNFVAHGSFGKDGEAFSFHSTAGAVPLRILDQKGGGQLRSRSWRILSRSTNPPASAGFRRPPLVGRALAGSALHHTDVRPRRPVRAGHDKGAASLG